MEINLLESKQAGPNTEQYRQPLAQVVSFTLESYIQTTTKDGGSSEAGSTKYGGTPFGLKGRMLKGRALLTNCALLRSEVRGGAL